VWLRISPDDEAVSVADTVGLFICDCCGKAQLVLYDETGAAFAEATLPDELIEQVADNRRQRRQAHWYVTEARYDRHMPHMR
jgi:hypothetical protein